MNTAGLKIKKKAEKNNKTKNERIHTPKML